MFSPLALILALGMLPQTMVPQTNLPKSLPPNCPADGPVDELMAEIRTQSKKQLRNKNPLPDEICIYGWCNRVKRPHSTRQPEIRLNDSGKSDNQDSATSNQKASSGKNAATKDLATKDAESKDAVTKDPATQKKESDASNSTYSSSSSSSKTAEADCDQAVEVALVVAHDVEVGDYSFEQKNYKGALLRYLAALEQKPMDAAILVRLGRVLERLNDVTRAVEHYQRASELNGPAKWTDEAKSALQRLGSAANLAPPKGQ